MAKCFHHISLQAYLWGISIIDDGCEKAQSTVDIATPDILVLGV